jgi:hypothetical protein
MKHCSIHGCDGKIKARGMCSKHYERVRRHNDPSTNYTFRRNRILINDVSTYLIPRLTAYEAQALKEMFFGGKHHGGLRINYGEALGIE